MLQSVGNVKTLLNKVYPSTAKIHYLQSHCLLSLVGVCIGYAINTNGASGHSTELIWPISPTNTARYLETNYLLPVSIKMRIVFLLSRLNRLPHSFESKACVNLLSRIHHS